MKKVYLIIAVLSLALLAGCGSRRGEVYSRVSADNWCEGHEVEYRDFVASCIKDANPKSDEEPEDWISQCEQTGKRIICPIRSTVTTYLCTNSDCSWPTKVDVRLATVEESKAATLPKKPARGIK